MHICLKTYAKREKKTQVQLVITERLPMHIAGPCVLNCELHVHAEKDHYVVTLESNGALEISCQRCLAAFSCDHKHLTTLAVCTDDLVASRLMARFDDVVVTTDELDLNHMITDELHLLVPERHASAADCDQTTLALLGVSCA